MKHTPGPWEYIRYADEPGFYIRNIHRGDMVAVANDLTESDAQFIVKACNHHYELLESLKTAVGLVELRYGNDPIVEPFLEKARTLITEVER